MSELQTLLVSEAPQHGRGHQEARTTKVKIMLLAVFKEAPAARVSRGWISVGYSQPMGPHDQAKPAMKMPAQGQLRLPAKG